MDDRLKNVLLAIHKEGKPGMILVESLFPEVIRCEKIKRTLTFIIDEIRSVEMDKNQEQQYEDEARHQRTAVSSRIPSALMGAELSYAESPECNEMVYNEYTSTGRKIPKRNPKAKPWISPYGGKRK